MNPLLMQFLTAVLRHLLMPVYIYLVAQGIITADQAEAMSGAFIVFVIGVGWSLYSKYRGKQMENTRAAMPPGATLTDAKELIASGTAARATTGRDESPRLKETV